MLAACYSPDDFPRVNPYDPRSNSDFDGDGVPNSQDAFPEDPNESADTDADGIGDNADNCAELVNSDQVDTDADGIGDACDGCLDFDSDRYGAGAACAGVDCDDNNDAVFAGAPEICNGLDDNCNDDVDEGLITTWYADADGDQFGDADVPMAACVGGSGWATDASDCNDTATLINPAATEICNGMDDDCDGQIDESRIDHLALWVSADAEAGAPETVTVEALDLCGNRATDYAGTVTFSSTDAQALLPDDYVFTVADAGSHTSSGVSSSEPQARRH